ncbi:MAG TPA: YhjD/YihY/BrkB family envelope integrity protein, partial [Methylomirabilota bacterium]|nr:YhjD/YihY/BrkB family envelope integrity protein [Methylomirabilota bacterium]
RRNRCPVRAASLAYTTLLALVPLLAVVVSVTTSMLQKQGEEPVQKLISQLVDYAAPALDLEARGTEPNEFFDGDGAPLVSTNVTPLATNALGATNLVSVDTNAPVSAINGRERVVKQITSFIANIRTGALGITSVIALLFVGISLLRTIEASLNDIWGVTRGRGWVKSIVYYWAAITLGPLFLVGALTLTTGPHLAGTRETLDRVPFLGTVLFHVLPFVILSVGFAAFYALMPNTKVHLKAALVGGAVGGCLWQLNNIFNVIYVSRVVTYTNIYGSLGVFPLFLVGMYFSWLIMLFGAQVSYAFQNRDAYIQEKQAGNVNQRGREFIALRLMTHIARNFLAGARPLSAAELSKQLGVPSQLSQKVLCGLVQNGLLVEALDTDVRFTPGRPLDRISAYQVICALRAGNGSELATTEDESRLLVRTEFERMVLAERQAGDAITMQTLAELSAKQVGNGPRELEARLPIAHGTTNG